MVHRFPGDHRQPLVDRQLGELRILHEVWPAPQDLPVAHLGEIGRHGLGQQHHVGAPDQLGTVDDTADPSGDLLVAHPEVRTVTALDQQVRSHLLVDPIQVGRVHGTTALVGLAGGTDHADGESIHGVLACRD